MFYNFRKQYEEFKVLQFTVEMFNIRYPEDGMVFAMGTHSKYPKSWLLIGVLRLNVFDQLSLNL
jgi:hypothetical protein